MMELEDVHDYQMACMSAQAEQVSRKSPLCYA